MRPSPVFPGLCLALALGHVTAHADNFVVTTAQVPVCNASQNLVWERIVNDRLGMEARDPEGHWISNYPVVHRDFWSLDEPVYRPRGVFKRTLCGEVGKYGFSTGTWSDEADWNIYLIPTPAFSSLLYDPIQQGAREIHDCSGGRNNCMEAEITPDERAYNNPLFPRSGPSPMVGRTVCVYGPWVADCDHGERPEIHPSEVVWWRQSWGGAEWTGVFMVQEDSNRFDRFSRGDWYYETGPYPHPNFRPWSQAPRRLEVRFPFEVGATLPRYRYDIHGLMRTRVTTAQPPDISADADDGTSHALEYNGQVLVAAEELEIEDNEVAVTFASLCREGSALRGYVQIGARLGENDNGREGFLLLNVGKFELEVQATPPELPPLSVSAELLTRPPEEGLVLAAGERGSGPVADLPFEITAVKGTTLAELTLRSAELVDAGGARRLLDFELLAPPVEGTATLGLLKAVPTLPPSVLELTSEAGTVYRRISDGHTVKGRFSDQSSRWTPADPGLWKSFATVAGGQAENLPGELIGATELNLTLFARYVPLREGEAMGEEGSSVSRGINEVLAEADSTRRLALFGNTDPLKASWTLSAVDLGSGQPLPVEATAEPKAGSVGYELLDGEGSSGDSARIVLGDDLSSRLVEVKATALVRDPFGNEGQATVAVWSHALVPEGGAEGLLAAAAEMRSLDAAQLLASSKLEISGSDPAAEFDRPGETARGARLVALKGLEDGRVTVVELADLLSAIDLYAENL